MRACERASKFWLASSVASIALLYVLFSFHYDLSLESWRTSRFNFANVEFSVSQNATTKKILFWNTMFGNDDFYFGKGDIFKDCPGISSQCWATHDRTLVSIDEIDALLVHGNEFDRPYDVPSTVRSRQTFVFVNLESPENRPIRYKEYDYDCFNATMTYRLDSDIVWTYADIRELHNGTVVAPKVNAVWNARLPEATGRQSSGNPQADSGATESSRDRIKPLRIRNKTRTAAWFVSNCHTKSKREKYVDELARHVDVDIFGLCGKSVGCPRGQDCFREVVEPNYYFYLSFENSMCQDYVTEKLYNALKYDVVPVVYGGANYTDFAPPKSYINALDFDSPRELAEYLKKLIQEPKEYEKYFEWKQRYEVVYSNKRTICELCKYLHESHPAKSYSPLSDWFATDRCPLQEKLQNLPYLTKKDLKTR